MAVEWSLEESSPVELEDLIEATSDMAEVIVGVRPTEMLATRRDDLMREEQAADERAFWADVTGRIVDQPFQINLTTFPDMDSHQNYIRTADTMSGYVEPTRAASSVAMGIAATSAWLKLAGGQLQGIGLGCAYVQADLPELIARFTYSDATPAERLELIKQRIWTSRDWADSTGELGPGLGSA